MHLSRQSLSVGDMPTLAKEFYYTRASTSTCLDSLLDDSLEIDRCKFSDYQQQQPVDLEYLMEVHRILTDLDRVLENV